MIVNQRKHVGPARADTKLLWYLRDDLGMTGTKFGCGRGLCGACTVHVDGKPVRSCQVAVEDLKGKAIVTIEGLASEGSLHPVQKAWLKHRVPQCGYCQPGQIMSVASCFQSPGKPKLKEMEAALSGHICRCGTYPRIQKALEELAK